jgi:predicted ATPase
LVGACTGKSALENAIYDRGAAQEQAVVGETPNLAARLQTLAERERTLHAQVVQVEGLSARQPVLMVFEDVHWSDPPLASRSTCSSIECPRFVSW